MKALLLLLFISFYTLLNGQEKPANLIIITLDGLRWQELFNGMDSAIANNSRFNQDDSARIYKNYWNPDPLERRKKLFPFIWTTLYVKGQIWGNRAYNNKVDNANPFWFSFPGYSEILTGYVDTSINSNEHPANPHQTILEFLHKKPAFKNRVGAFGAWHAFDRIINEKRAGFPVISAFDPIGGKSPNANERLINAMNKDAFKAFNEYECLDVFTHYGAMEFLKNKKPGILYIAYGETDEWAHAGMYRSYLDAAKQVDAWISNLWNYLQADPAYKNKTALFITTDHGRGDIIKSEWTSHNNKITGANEIWFAVMGPGIPAKGEISSAAQVYQKQFAQTIAYMLGYHFKTDHPVAEKIEEVFKRR